MWWQTKNLRGKINAGDLRSPLHTLFGFKICAVNLYAVTGEK